jgi:hypothetical protein
MNTKSFCILVDTDCKFLKNEAMFDFVAQFLILFFKLEVHCWSSPSEMGVARVLKKVKVKVELFLLRGRGGP